MRVVCDITFETEATATDLTSMSTHDHAMFHHAERGNLKKLRQMLRWASAPDVNANDGDGFTLLMCAVIFGRPEVWRLLLKAGADPSLTIDHPDGLPDTALTLAVRGGQELCLEEVGDRLSNLRLTDLQLG